MEKIITFSSPFNDYMISGGFPYCTLLGDDKIKVNQYLESVYNTIIIKDIIERQSRLDKNNRNTDIPLLKSVAKYLFDVIGNPTSIKKITNYLNSNNRRVSDHTISKYVSALCKAFIFYPVERYDLKGKEILKTNKKYYAVDIGLRSLLIAKNPLDIGFILEILFF